MEKVYRESRTGSMGRVGRIYREEGTYREGERDRHIGRVAQA